jgi:hypothetical protein
MENMTFVERICRDKLLRRIPLFVLGMDLVAYALEMNNLFYSATTCPWDYMIFLHFGAFGKLRRFSFLET